MTRLLDTLAETLPSSQLERLRALSDILGLEIKEIMTRALEKELQRMESEISEDGRLSKVKDSILSQPQSLSLSGEEFQGSEETCQLCLRPLPDAGLVDGPLLCPSCLQLAQSEERAEASR